MYLNIFENHKEIIHRLFLLFNSFLHDYINAYAVYFNGLNDFNSFYFIYYTILIKLSSVF